MYIRLPKTLWASYVRSTYILCPGGIEVCEITCLACFCSLHASPAYVPFLRILRAFTFTCLTSPSIFRCLTCLHFFMCLACLQFLGALRDSRAFTFFYKMCNKLEYARTRQNKQKEQPKQDKTSLYSIGELLLAKYPCEYFFVTQFGRRFQHSLNFPFHNRNIIF